MVDGLGGNPLVRPVAVLGATGAVGGRFVEIVAGEGRSPVRVLLHRWWHTARVVRFPVDLRDASAGDADAFAGQLDGCVAAISFVDGADADAALAESLVEGCARAGVDRLVHLGCLGSFGAVTEGRLDEGSDPPRPAGRTAARRWAFEQALLRAGDRAGLPVVVVVAPLVYGPFTEQGAHVPHAEVERGRVAIARGSGPCHLVFVDDAVEAMWAAATAPGHVHGRVLINGPSSITWPAFFGAFESIVGRPGVVVLPDEELAALAQADPAVRAELRWPPPPSTGRRVVGAIARRTVRRGSIPTRRRRLVVPDADELAARAARVEVPLDRAAAVLGWTPSVDFDEGMRRTEAYLRWADPR